jgi:hypothetical protein
MCSVLFPATHVITPEAILRQPQQVPTTSPRVPPTPMPTPPPRVQPTVHSFRVPTSLPTSPPSARPKTLFPAVASYEEGHYKRRDPYQSTKVSGPSAVKPYTQAILPYEPTSTPLKKPHQTQQITDLGILEATSEPDDGPSRNTCSKT